jgi:hypothetical protein
MRVIESRRRVATLDLCTYLIGNAMFWTLWPAVAVTADSRYWRLAVPFVGWTNVLVLHLWLAYRFAA